MGMLGGVTTAFADSHFSYAVQAGDTATQIALHYGVTVPDLQASNPGVNLDHLAIGQVLNIAPASSASSGRSSAAPPRPSLFPASFNWASTRFPSFAISPDGVVTRSRSDLPPLAQGGDVIVAPFRSQLDGSVWAGGNCGPTSLSMALGVFGINADQLTLRNLANRQMGDFDPSDGTTWESLAYAAGQYGVSTSWLYDGADYRAWTLDDLRAELAQGHPVILLVRYWDLPDHLTSTFAGDHYILALGFDAAGDVIYHDPAEFGDGAYRAINPTQLLKAWTDTWVGQSRTAMALVD
jgi:hypothetical protein